MEHGLLLNYEWYFRPNVIGQIGTWQTVLAPKVVQRLISALLGVRLVSSSFIIFLAECHWADWHLADCHSTQTSQKADFNTPWFPDTCCDRIVVKAFGAAKNDQVPISSTFYTHNLQPKQNKLVHFENTPWEHDAIANSIYFVSGL